MVALAARHIAALVDKDVAAAVRLDRCAAAVPASVRRRRRAAVGGGRAADMVEHRCMLLTLRLHLAFFLLDKGAGHAADRDLGRQKVPPKLMHERRRALFEKAGEGNLHLAWIRILR